MTVKSVGIIGYGNFGQFLYHAIKRFAPAISVRVYSEGKTPDGTLFFSAEEAAGSDIVLFSVPISSMQRALVQLVPLIPADSIIVDVATVKTYSVSLLQKYAVGSKYVATHPMFGPESYEKKGRSVSGLRIVVAEHTLSDDEYESLRHPLAALGFDIVRMDAASHDKHLAETLFLTHYIGQIVARAGFDRTMIDTVSFGFLMDAVESVKNDTALFKDVYRYDPYCKEVMQRFGIAEQEVSALLNDATVQI